ncbi:MAG: hypothetical protein KAX49_05435 [Halanaerobiales bacterium]|nr:hypothetical protein [Halanaerobiales bacterium]
MKRYVISGAGVVSKFGIGRESFQKNICLDQSKELYTEKVLKDTLKGMKKEITDYDLSGWGGMDELTRYAVIASLLAVQDAEIDLSSVNPEEIGIFFGTVFGCLESNVKFNKKLITSSPRYVSRLTFCNTVSNAAIGHIGLILGAKGVHTTCVSGGLYPLIYGIQQLKAGRIKIGFIGGMEKLSPIVIQGMEQLEIGNFFQDGAGTLVIESLTDCQKRNGNILAEVVSYGVGSDFTESMKEAFKRADCTPEEIAWLVPHAYGSKWDKDEENSIMEIFESKNSTPIIYSLKEKIGEPLGVGLSMSIISVLPKMADSELVMINSASYDSTSKGTIILRKFVSNKEV